MASEPLRVLVDTNVWVSALLTPSGPPAAIVEALRQGRFVPVVSDSLLDEVREVLDRPRIRRRIRASQAEVSELIAQIERVAVRAVPTGRLQLCRDPEDDFVIEAALLGGAAFLVSRDDDLKRDLALVGQLEQLGLQVLSVAEFLRYLSRE